MKCNLKNLFFLNLFIIEIIYVILLQFLDYRLFHHEVILLILFTYIYILLSKLFFNNIFNLYFLIFYIFMILYIWLSCNPIEIDKYATLNKIPDKYKPFTIKFNKKLNFSKLKFPLILKPNICSTGGKGIEIVENIEDLLNYYKKNGDDFIIQEYICHNFEVGLLYERYPFEKKGRIINIIEKKYIKNSKFKYYNSDVEIINHINNSNLITKKLSNIIDNITKKINKNIFVGRYDIIFNSYQELKNGKFKIVELNGVFAEDFIVNTNINEIEIIIYNLKWFFVRFIIGFLNVISLNGVNIIKLLKHIINSPSYALKCNDITELAELYT